MMHALFNARRLRCEFYVHKWELMATIIIKNRRGLFRSKHMERAHHWFSRRYCRSFADSQLALDVKPQFHGLPIIRIDKVIKKLYIE